MKNIVKFIAILFIFISVQTNAQDYTTIEIEDIEPETARLVVNQAFKDLKLPPMHIWNNETSAESSFYRYTSLMVKNRFIFKVEVEPNKLIISIINRQYFTNNVWDDSPLPMSKKKAAKILDPIKDKIKALINTNI